MQRISLQPGLPGESMLPSRWLGFLIVGAALVLAVWPAVAHAVEVWSTDEEFTYGFLIPPIALAVVWWRRQALRRSIGSGRNAGLVIVALAILLLLLSRRTGIHAVGGLAVTPL